MYYSIQHQTRFRYDSPVSESIMELHMQPRSEGRQRCLSYFVKVNPKARVLQYRDHLGNHVHHFSVAPKHTQLLITTEATVESLDPDPLPGFLPVQAWDELDRMLQFEDFWEFLMPSDYAGPSELLKSFAEEIHASRREDPLTLVVELNRSIYNAFQYVPKHTHVNSPIDHALADRKGVCQDFAHILIALLRGLGIPARYVSGYVYRGKGTQDRSLDGASHAWVEAMLPGLGWVGLDPTNNLLASGRHIRTAIGRDYADVPPTRGTFRGGAQSELDVLVRVTKTDAQNMEDPAKELLFNSNPPVFGERIAPLEEDLVQQQQQQQQQ
ncbi:MAG: transglutaminase family protein [Acidobacteria bacterium]|nr:transglutaminase family protein [Acidobacteriota bacterium]